jgi:hypothetical protein
VSFGTSKLLTLGSGRWQKAKSTYFNWSLSREPSIPSMMCFLLSPRSLTPGPPQNTCWFFSFDLWILRLTFVETTISERLHPRRWMHLPITSSPFPEP